MKRPLLFVHGAGEGAYEEDSKMVASLRDALGSGYEARYPKMPDADSPKYAAWSERIASELAELDGEVVLVGHSLGASILLKHISEEMTVIPVAGMFLLATPYWGVEDWEVGEYILQKDFAAKLPGDLPIFFYHSRDDEWVPFAHLELYAKKLPHATFREFDGRGHQFDGDLSEVAHDIERLERSES